MWRRPSGHRRISTVNPKTTTALTTLNPLTSKNKLNVTRWACLVCEKSVEIREICGQQISAQFAKEQAECIYSPTDRTRRFSQKPCGVPLSKKHGLHRCARMGLFTDSLLLLRCPPLGFRCAVGATDCHGFFRMRRVVWENVTRWACLVCEKSVEIREICGRQLSAQCAKEQAGCFYSPTDLSDKQMPCDCLSITQIAPSAPCDRLTLNIKIAGDGLP